MAGAGTLGVSIALADGQDAPWLLTAVYGPVDHHLQDAFMNELRAVKSSYQGPLLVCGDFNLIYQAADKSNDRLNRSSMRRFRRALDDTQLQELYLNGRLYTWSNERRRPTLERIDRAFVSVEWLDRFPSHHLRCLSTDCSDHAPLLLQLRCAQWAKPRFRFEDFWTRLDGFEETVKKAWDGAVPAVDACRIIDIKLRRTARALQS